MKFFNFYQLKLTFVKKRLAFLSLLFVSFLVSCQYLEKKRIYPKKTQAQEISQQEQKTWEDIKKEKNLSLEKKIQQLNRFIRANKDKNTALSAYLLKAQWFVKHNQKKQACLTYYEVLNSSFAYKNSWPAYHSAFKCQIKEGNQALAIKTLETFIQQAHQKTEDKKKAAQLLWSLLKPQKEFFKEKLRALSYLHSFSASLKEKQSFLKEGQSLIHPLSQQELTFYAHRSQEFKLFEVYLLYRAGQLSLESKELKTAERFFKKLLTRLKDDGMKKQIEQTLIRIKQATQTNPYLIGVILPLSGPRKVLGEKLLRALSVGFELNRGAPWQLLVLDSQDHSERVKSQMEDLFYKHHAVAVIGGLSSETAGAMAEKAEEFSIPAILLSQKSGLTKDRPFVFQNAVTAEQLLEPLIQELRENLKVQSVAILSPDDTYGRNYSLLFEESFKESNGRIESKVLYKSGEVDFKNQITKLLKFKNRQKEFEEKKAEILKQDPSLLSRSVKLTPENVLSADQKFSALFIPDGPKALKVIEDHLKYFGLKDIYLLGLNVWREETVNSQDFPIRFVNLKEFEKNRSPFYREFFKQYNYAPGHFEERAYNSALFLKQGLKKGISRFELQKQLDSMKSFKGAYSTMNLSEDRIFQYPLKIYKKDLK